MNGYYQVWIKLRNTKGDTFNTFVLLEDVSKMCKQYIKMGYAIEDMTPEWVEGD